MCSSTTGGGIVVLYKKDNLYEDNYSKIKKIKQTNEIAYTINGIKVKDSFPTKESGLKSSTNNVTCENGVTAEWSNDLWGLVNINSNNNNEISCNIDFTYEGTLIDYVKMMSNYSNEIVKDVSGELRYIGANPNNYVQFNGELWRIIGVMKGIENPDGTKSDKVKLIRSESIGSYAWDNKPDGTGSSTSIEGSNNWTDSELQKVLNEGAYYNRTSGDCPSGSNGATKSCDFSDTGLTNDAKNMISEVVWSIGGIPNSLTELTYLSGYEKGNYSYNNNPVKWTGHVGLMYPSEYGYATNGGSKTNRDTCIHTSLGTWNGSGVSDCKNNDWLYNSSTQWTITPTSLNGYQVLYVGSSGKVGKTGTTTTYAIRPSIYLKSDIGIENGGTGTSASPIKLKVN